MALKQEVQSIPGLGDVSIVRQKLKAGGLLDFSDADKALMKTLKDPVLKQSLMSNPSFAQLIKNLEGGQVISPTQELAKIGLQEKGITDFVVTPQEMANLQFATQKGLIPELESYEKKFLSQQALPQTSLQDPATGRTFDPTTGAIFDAGGQQVPGVTGGMEKQFAKPVSQTGSLQGTMGAAAQPQPVQPLQAPQPQPGQPQFSQLQQTVIDQAQQLGNNVLANKEYVNAVFKAFHGRDANQGELNEFTNKGVQDVFNAIKAGAPTGGVSGQQALSQGITPVEDFTQFEAGLQGLPNLAAGTPAGDLTGDFTQALQAIQQPVTDIQNKILESLASQPGQAELLQQFKQDFGVDALIGELTKLSQAAQPLEDALKNLPQDILDRYEDIGLSEAQRRRRLAVEAKPLTDSIADISQAKALTLEQLQLTDSAVKDALDAVMEDQANNNGIILQQLEFAQGNADQQKEILDLQFKIALSALEDQMKVEQPNIMTDKSTDAAGNVTIVGIDKITGEKVWEQNLGQVGKGFKYPAGAGAGAEDDKVFLDENYFRTIMTEGQLKAEAKKLGFAGAFKGKKQEIQEYLDHLMGIIEAYRSAGFTDEEILKKMQ